MGARVCALVLKTFSDIDKWLRQLRSGAFERSAAYPAKGNPSKVMNVRPWATRYICVRQRGHGRRYFHFCRWC